jgi:hypothetical protein
VDPYICLGVAGAESSTREVEFRFGKMGRSRYYGPFGIHKCFLDKWRIDDPYVNTEVGIRALARHKDDLRRSLKKYNAEFNEGYYKRVIFLAKKYRKERVFDGLPLVRAPGSTAAVRPRGAECLSYLLEIEQIASSEASNGQQRATTWAADRAQWKPSGPREFR